MKFLINSDNKDSINSYSINLSNYSSNSIRIDHFYIDNLKPLIYFEFYIQENTSRTEGILINIPFSNDTTVILYHLKMEFQRKCENKYQIELVNGKLSISCNENFNLVFSNLGKEVFPVLGFNKTLYKYKKSYVAEIGLNTYLDVDPNYVYISYYYNNNNLICRHRLPMNKRLRNFNEKEFCYFPLPKYINNVKIKLHYDKNNLIPYIHSPILTIVLDLLTS